MTGLIPYGRQSIDKQDLDSVISVLQSDWLTTGPKVPEFENLVAGYTGCQHAVAVNSGTSALDVAIQSLNLPHGSEIITTPFTFAATSNAILYHGHTPVYADIVRNSRNIDPDSVQTKITDKTRAVIAVDFAGLPCELERLRRICGESDIFLIEDACHSLGGAYHQKRIGSIADMTIFSFHPVKAVTTGEGGMVVTNNHDLAKRMSLLRTHGIDKTRSPFSDEPVGWEYDMVALGRNYRMTDIQAALGMSQFKKLDSFIQRRNELAKVYSDLLSDSRIIETPKIPENVVHAWHIYTVLLDGVNRNAVFRYMRDHDVGVNLHYIPTYRFHYYQEHFSIRPEDYPVTEDVFSRIITLPLFPTLTEGLIHNIVGILEDACRTVST